MSEVNKNIGDVSTEVFNSLSFERKLVELVEELRLRRDLETEGEKTLKSVMDEKYEEELSWEEQQRRYTRVKEDLEQQIGLLKRKLEDKVCVSDDDKVKQQMMNKTYSREIRMLKEDLRISKSEKLNLQKKIQELEGKLKLHNNFQESIMTQMSSIRKMVKSVNEESQELATAQKSVMENVASTKAIFKKYDLCNQHLQQCLTIVGKKSEIFKKELISARSELTMLQQSVKSTQENKPNHENELEKMQQKILDLENLLLLSRKENEKTQSNFLESNNVLCKLMDKYSDSQDREKRLNQELESFQDKLNAAEQKLRETEDQMKNSEEMAALGEKARIENQVSTAVQTKNSFENLLCTGTVSENGLTPRAIFAQQSDGMCQDFMNKIRNGLRDLQQNAVVVQSESCVKNCGQDVSVGRLPIGSSHKKITVSEVLKRKLEILESGDSFELISVKKRFSQDNTPTPLYTINPGQNEGLKNGVQISVAENTINPGQNEGFKRGMQILVAENTINPGQIEGFKNGVQISAAENAITLGLNEGLKNGVQISAAENAITLGQNEGLKNGVQISTAENAITLGQNEGLKNGVQISTAENAITLGQNEGLKNGVQISAAANIIKPAQIEGFKNDMQISAAENTLKPAQNEGFKNGVQISAAENNTPLCIGMGVLDSSRSTELYAAFPIDHKYLRVQDELAEKESSKIAYNKG